MPVILKRDYIKYIPKEEIKIQRKYGGSLGRAIYLPKGEGIGDIFNFFNANKENIKTVVDTVGKVASVASSIAKLTTDTVKGIDEIKALRQKNLQLQASQQPISEKALNNIVNNDDGVSADAIKIAHRVPKKGGGFSVV